MFGCNHKRYDTMADYSRRSRREKQKSPLPDMSLINVDDPELSSFESEVREWNEVNHRLRRNGFSKVKLLHPENVWVSSGDVVCFDLATSESLRETLNCLMNGGDISMIDKYQNKCKDLKIMLECSRARVKELENESQRSTSKFGDVSHLHRKNTPPSDSENRKFELLCKEKDLQIDMLQRKLHKLVEEDHKRTTRQNQVFQEFKKRTARAHSVMDEKLLDVIDSYEKQVYSMQRELDKLKQGEYLMSDVDEIIGLRTHASNNMKGVIKAYEKQLRECHSKIDKLEEERDVLLLNLGGKPDLKEYRTAALRVKKLEKLLALHNIGISGEKRQKDPFRTKRNYSTRTEELDCLPLDFCQHYLKEICSELAIDDMQRIVPCLQDLKDDAKDFGMYEQFHRKVHAIIQNVQGHSRGHRSSSKHPPPSERNMKCDLDILENWRQDIAALKGLQNMVNTVLMNLAPWAKVHFTEDHSVTQMVQLLDSLAFEESGVVKKKCSNEQLSRTQMENIVDHFQTLFDIPTVEGIFPRMNEIYTKLGEVHNIMHTLKNFLGLSEDVNSSGVVDAVGHLCESHNTTTTKQLQQLLQTHDLVGVIRRLDEHSQFFPAFKQIMMKLMEMLDIERIDQVIPAVRALKMLSS